MVIIGEIIDGRANLGLLPSSLDKCTVDGFCHHAVAFNITCEGLDFISPLDVATKGSGHLALRTSNHRTTSLGNVASERHQAHTAHVGPRCGKAVHDECVPENKTNGDVDAWVVVKQFVRKTDDARLSRDDGCPACWTSVVEFVEWEEGCSASPVL